MITSSSAVRLPLLSTQQAVSEVAVAVPLSGRDLKAVQLVARFKQVSSHHVHELIYGDLSSRTPCDRALKRLVSERFLIRIERRIVGGGRGGSGQYVYALGRRGFFSNFSGKYNPARVVNYHCLAIVDSYIVMKHLEQQGKVKLLALSTEPDCWTEIGGTILKPDMYIELATPTADRVKLWFEIDMGSEAQRQLKGKLEAYWRAYNEADVAKLPVFPRVLWVAVDDERATELSWLVQQGHRDSLELFQVTTLDKLATLF